MSARSEFIRFAKVCIAEARRRRHQRFSWTLLQWAANGRRRAAQCPRQRELFGGAP